VPGIAELPLNHLRLVMADAIIGGIKEPFQPRRPITEDEMVTKLWREAPVTVRRVFHEIADKRAGVDYYRVRDTTKATKGTREARRRRPQLTRNKRGLPLSEMARRTYMALPTFTALLVHHGFLELVPYGSRRRHLVTESAFRAEVGHNVYPKNRIGHLEGYRRAAVFPVFYEDRLKDILWCLDYQGIVEAVDAIPSKRKRLAWLLGNHTYLPNREIAQLVGCSEVGVKKARARAKVSSCVIEHQGAQCARAKVSSCVIERPEGFASKREPRSHVHVGQLTGRGIHMPTWASDRTAMRADNVEEAA
jgi:hypothetical protein